MQSKTLTVSHTFTADAYRSLAEIAGLTVQGLRLSEFAIQAQTNGVTVRLGDDAQPSSTAPGIDLTSGQALGVGPADNAPYDLRKVWVRNETPGSNATVVLVGRVVG